MRFPPNSLEMERAIDSLTAGRTRDRLVGEQVDHAIDTFGNASNAPLCAL